MDFDKLPEQRARMAEVVRDAPTKPTPSKVKGTSKRQGWKAATWYVQPETRDRLKRLLMRGELDGNPVAEDQSAAVDEAIREWLERHGGCSYWRLIAHRSGLVPLSARGAARTSAAPDERVDRSIAPVHFRIRAIGARDLHLAKDAPHLLYAPLNR